MIENVPPETKRLFERSAERSDNGPLETKGSTRPVLTVSERSKADVFRSQHLWPPTMDGKEMRLEPCACVSAVPT